MILIPGIDHEPDIFPNVIGNRGDVMNVARTSTGKTNTYIIYIYIHRTYIKFYIFYSCFIQYSNIYIYAERMLLLLFPSYIIICHHISSYIIIYHNISSYFVIYHHISSYIITYHHIPQARKYV